MPYPSSKANENSKGCKIENDLDLLKVALGSADGKLLDFEQRCISDWQTVKAKDVEEVAAVATSIDKEIKTGRKKLSALKALWKL